MKKIFVLMVLTTFYSLGAQAIRPCDQTLFPRICCEIFPNNPGCSSRPYSSSDLANVSSGSLSQFLAEPSLTSAEKKRIRAELAKRKK
jgi:hypothetical protein